VTVGYSCQVAFEEGPFSVSLSDLEMGIREGRAM
jgi:hypothetical protein